MFEKEIVQAAAANHQSHELKQLEILCDKIVTSTSVLDGIQADYEFHELLVIMAKNPAVLIIFQGLSSVLKKVLHQRRIWRGSREKRKRKPTKSILPSSTLLNPVTASLPVE